MDSSISSVVVYPDRARIMRRGEVTLKEGVHHVEIPDLSIHLDTDSLRVSARGSARARVLSLRVQKKFYAETPVDYVKELETQVETAGDELSRLDAQVLLVNDQKTRISDLAGHTKTYAKAMAKGEIKVEAQLALFDSLRARHEKLEAEAQNLVRQKREQERRLEKLKKQLDQVHSARQRERYSAFVEVEVFQAGDLTVELNYVVPSAGWEPLYDMRFLEEGGKPRLEVGYLAQITQRTGENWGGVSLTLSTTRPALSGRLPELDPWYVAPYPKPVPRPEPRMARAQMVTAVPAMEPDAAAEPQPEYEAEEAYASVSESGTSVTYQVPGKVVVPTDGEPHKVTVARFMIPLEMDYVTAPKIVQAAHRRARVINDSSMTLLAGSANIFAGDEFVGTTALELTASQGEIELYLGVDDRIKVERELKRRDVDKVLIGGKRRIHYAYEIELQNLAGREIPITVHDQIPVSRHEDIKVKLEGVEPKPNLQSELNILTWELTLAPEQEAHIRIEFTIEHPGEMSVAGLP